MSENGVEDFFRFGSLFLTCILIPLTLVGLTCNGITAYIFLKPGNRPSVNFFLGSLALFDSGVLIFGTISFFSLGLLSFDQASASPVLILVVACATKFLYPLAMISRFGGTYVLVCVTIERFIAVRYPLHARQICTLYKARLVVCVVTLVSTVYNFSRFFEYKWVYANTTTALDGTGGNASSQSSALEWEISIKNYLRSNEAYQVVYTLWMYLITFFIIPFLLLLLLNTSIVVVLRKANAVRESMSRSEKQERSTTKMMVVTVIVFLLTNTLPFVLAVWEVVGKNVHSYSLYFLTDFSNTLVELNSALNFVIYFKFGKSFRHDVVALLQKHRLSWLLSGLRIASDTNQVTTAELYSGNPLQRPSFQTSSDPPIYGRSRTASRPEIDSMLLNPLLTRNEDCSHSVIDQQDIILNHSPVGNASTHTAVDSTRNSIGDTDEGSERGLLQVSLRIDMKQHQLPVLPSSSPQSNSNSISDTWLSAHHEGQ